MNIYEIKYIQYEYRVIKLEDNMTTFFSIILAYCTHMVKIKFKGMTNYETNI